jgi:hypothetical protein
MKRTTRHIMLINFFIVYLTTFSQQLGLTNSVTPKPEGSFHRNYPSTHYVLIDYLINSVNITLRVRPSAIFTYSALVPFSWMFSYIQSHKYCFCRLYIINYKIIKVV